MQYRKWEAAASLLGTNPSLGWWCHLNNHLWSQVPRPAGQTADDCLSSPPVPGDDVWPKRVRFRRQRVSFSDTGTDKLSFRKQCFV